jgi:hypothetical protein
MIGYVSMLFTIQMSLSSKSEEILFQDIVSDLISSSIYTDNELRCNYPWYED